MSKSSHSDNLTQMNYYAGMKVPYKKVFGFQSYLVDGRAIRRNINIDFVMGDNGFHSPRYIPKNEIWIDEQLPPDERQFILLHEAVESYKMRNAMKYVEAHKYASHAEQAARQKYLGFDWINGTIPELTESVPKDLK